ncbi:Long-chain acyl-CoA thioesterase FadM [Thalassoglobus neptunius]|uniref:Long-chain acyl-CoA thioesterase FadM n=1 Tax=Thalassoglobus neptunius TaxID=1938619 RepID=A0A5C5W869_9PLAN|nr:acyl-CoA thioesterase [Thalassoglobus neptunius]TWT46375.1 Long-chain acyl-CoA thioesterase FadM [Thalassoglobus neptunius]
MPRYFEFLHTVREEDIDPQNHANNVVYLEWLQSAAIAHSAEQGWSTQRYRDNGWAWVVRSHFIEYRRPAFLGDSLTIHTWVADMKKFSSLRKYEVVFSESGKLVARAETNWAFVTTEAGRLIAIPDDVAESFEVSPDRPKA